MIMSLKMAGGLLIIEIVCEYNYTGFMRYFTGWNFRKTAVVLPVFCENPIFIKLFSTNKTPTLFQNKKDFKYFRKEKRLSFTGTFQSEQISTGEPPWGCRAGRLASS